MEFSLQLAALLLVFVSFVHSYLGERYILTRLFKRNNIPHLLGSDDFTKRTLRFAWHLTSVAWIGFAAILWVIAQPELSRHSLLLVISVTFGLHFVFALIGSRGKHLSWLLFAAVSLFVFIGTS